MKKELTISEVAKMGGIASAKKLTKKQRKKRAENAGRAQKSSKLKRNPLYTG